jgi:hypothetical protein
VEFVHSFVAAKIQMLYAGDAFAVKLKLISVGAEEHV